MKLYRPLCLWVVSAALAVSCATVQPAGATAFRVECNVADAFVLVDDVLVGRVSEWSQRGRHIRPGSHRIEIRHPNYHAHYQEITATDGAELVIKTELRPLLD